MSKPSTELALVGTETLPAPHAGTDILTNPVALEHAEKIAKRIAASPFAPKSFANKPEEVLMAMILAQDMGERLFTVLNAVHFVGGRPGFSAQYLIGRANTSGIFAAPLYFETTGEGASLAVTCSTTLRATGQRVSRTVTMEQARKEQWTRNAKYSALAEQMLSYRAATFLIRLYAPQLTFGVRPVDELEDIAAARGEPVTYIDPFPSSSAPARRSISVASTLPGGEGRAAEDDLSAGAAPSGEDVGAVPNGASSTHAVPATPSVVASEAGPREGALGSERDGTSPSSALSQAVSPPMETQPAAQGADLGDERAAVLAEVAALREECPLLLREQAQAMGLKTPSRAPTAKLRELVAITRGRRPLVGLPDAELLERIGAAWGNVADHDWALTLAEVAGLPVSDKGPVLDGAPRPMLERYLVTLLLAVEQQQTQRQDTAVREALLVQAREVLREMSSEAAGEAFERLGILTLEDCDEEQLREFVRQAGGGA